MTWTWWKFSPGDTGREVYVPWLIPNRDHGILRWLIQLFTMIFICRVMSLQFYIYLFCGKIHITRVTTFYVKVHGLVVWNTSSPHHGHQNRSSFHTETLHPLSNSPLLPSPAPDFTALHCVSRNLTTWEWFSLHVGTKCSPLGTRLRNYGGKSGGGSMSQTVSTSTLTFKYYTQLSFCFHEDNERS